MSQTKIYMNLSIPESIKRYQDLPFDGIGLLRLEFLISSQVGVHPSKLVRGGKTDLYVNKLAEGMKKVTGGAGKRPVVVRFSDFKSNEYRKLEGGEEFEPKEENPMMGVRGVSRYVSKKHNFRDVFKAECKAVRKVREKQDNLWAMIPFVRKFDEVDECLEIMREAGLKSSDNFNVWLMVEVPSMAIKLEEFNELPIDGYSIGSNDLCQFLFGVGRDNSELNEMGYFDESEQILLQMMETVIKKAHEGGKTCSICGESVSNNLQVARRLVKREIDSLSVNPDKVEEFKRIF